jgi:hypothetical protein
VVGVVGLQQMTSPGTFDESQAASYDERFAKRAQRGLRPRERSRLGPVRVVASAAKPLLVEPSSPLLELTLPTGVVVRFPPGTEPSYLRALLTAL